MREFWNLAKGEGKGFRTLADDTKSEGGKILLIEKFQTLQVGDF